MDDALITGSISEKGNKNYDAQKKIMLERMKFIKPTTYVLFKLNVVMLTCTDTAAEVRENTGKPLLKITHAEEFTLISGQSSKLRTNGTSSHSVHGDAIHSQVV